MTLQVRHVYGGIKLRKGIGGSNGRDEFLVNEHRRVVDNFIEDATNVLSGGLSVAERNELGVKLRFYVETQLVPGILAVNALHLEASAEMLNRNIPELIERASTVLPAEAAFLTEAGKMVDPRSYALLAENLDLLPDQCFGVEVFHDHLLSMAPLVAKVRPL